MYKKLLMKDLKIKVIMVELPIIPKIVKNSKQIRPEKPENINPLKSIKPAGEIYAYEPKSS